MAEIAIVGAGLMGHGIALVMAPGGHAVRLTERRESLSPRMRAPATEAREKVGQARSSDCPGLT
ncbi:3-hydroxyacyl-CoA dehydrogenase NAD-binding domain-containing protein [Methylobacterium trifolii]